MTASQIEETDDVQNGKQSKTSVKSEKFTPSSGYSAITKERDLKMRSPRPVEGRAKNYVYQGSFSSGRLRLQIGGFKHPNFYPNPNPNPNALTRTLNPNPNTVIHSLYSYSMSPCCVSTPSVTLFHPVLPHHYLQFMWCILTRP